MATMLSPDTSMELPAASRSIMPVLEPVGPTVLEDCEGTKPQPSPRANPPPNPPFVFPAREFPSSAPSSYSRATGRRPKSFADSFHLGVVDATRTDRRASLSPQLQDFSFNPGARSPNLERPSTGRSPLLPDFKFNPGAALAPTPPEHPFLSPPQSPHSLQAPPSPRATASRPGGHGHRRGGSEFVGGQIRSGDAITVLSTSPTKSESGFASPQLKPVNPRRGHQHRRSAAISSHDLSIILKPTSPQPRGSSAPSSPIVNDPIQHFSFPTLSEGAPEPEKSGSVKPEEPAVANVAKSEPVQEETRVPAKPVNRARVGFSDTLEFIPRPLSLVSSDTSSTMTARPGHSLSGSISSLISLTSTTSHERTDMYALSPSPSRNSADTRPSTAGAILERSLSPLPEGPIKSPQRRNSIPLLNISATNAQAQPDTPSPGKAQKRWSFFGLEPFVGSMSPTQPRRSSASSSDTTTKHSNSSISSVGLDSDSAPDAVTEEDAVAQKSSNRKNGKVKKKKVRSWAGSILTKKTKSRHSKKPSKSRCPPALASLQASVGSTERDDEVESERIVQQATVPCTASADDDIGEVRPDTPPEDEPSFPMIDLDAALGPFNTPLPRNPEWEAAQRASGLTKRPLHSAARISGFSGPGMNYQHRRAESAPEMPPFNRAGLPRYNSNSTMADVFEEDEEEEGKTSEKMHRGDVIVAHDGIIPDGQASNINIRVTPDASCSPSVRASDYEDDAISSRALSRKGSGLSGLSDEDRTQLSMGVTSASSLHDEIIMEESPDVKWNLKDHSGVSSGHSSDSSTPSPCRIFKGKDLAPVDVSPLHLPTQSLAPVSPYSIGNSSSFPSPRSPMSYEDGNRISTAPSSVTEDTFQSLLMGEPGPEVRISMEIPSLTSSNSTMTRESAFVHQLSQPPVRGERPASFSSPFGRRGSLASIGRLISTSHGERSKLSTEMSIDTDQTDKKQKTGKVKRLSRLMQFWKPKETSSAQ